MTLYLLDIASYQTTERRPNDPLDLVKAKAAGFSLVNIKIGQGDWYAYRSWMRTYADSARALGMGISTFHWLDNSASGATQAALAYQRMKDIGGPNDMAHQCDCEDSSNPATFTIWRDYVSAMQDKLGRHIINYTGDWWWVPRKWTGATLTPYLWAAPNNGYLSTYPGDSSTAWHAGYGGWAEYSALQYAVSPISGAGGGNISKTAIRDPKVWAALTGGNVTNPLQEDIVPVPPEAGWDPKNTTGWATNSLHDIWLHSIYARRASENAVKILTDVVTTLTAVAAKVDIDPTELDAIKIAAREGATAATDSIVTAILDRLPDGVTLTRDDVEQAVRHAFSGGLAPAPTTPTQ